MCRPDAVLDAISEQDRIFAFCESGVGHVNVVREPAEHDHNPMSGVTTTLIPERVYCEDCGTDLNEYARLNPDSDWS